ncbi:oxidoreductase [Enterococcus faecalis]|uniref:NAD(P)H-binding protein n=1 Tax=Enterococcus faecalis TaxID=1351 RepID=UPI001142A25E|nr:NAD(P)H-binding protein [Enterococcus faecalis]EIA6622680.1 NAD(P)H-binding protein [Enterococcus faecalis]EIA6786910.1 NAD(P)H-binding protein [Enterococcus faecalis]MBP4074877.1 NAD(P)H-binding protein [Enterococcus faecalis]MBP4092985.1 NAD(P)H-binding protein [Enterococcus faecalis]MUN81733.1 NAD(P)H-binding protein [Enterococcus faecalis]
MNVLILGANGQIARIVEERILNESAFEDVLLTLGLRNPSRLQNLSGNSRVILSDVDLNRQDQVEAAVEEQDLVFVAAVDHDKQNRPTKNVIAAMKTTGVKRVLYTNILGLYNEVPGEFGRWNLAQVRSGLNAAITSDRLLADSGVDYTTLRLPWLNNRDEIKYEVTHKDETYVGVSGSRKSIADLILRIISDPTLYSKGSIGIADAATQGLNRPVY